MTVNCGYTMANVPHMHKHFFDSQQITTERLTVSIRTSLLESERPLKAFTIGLGFEAARGSRRLLQRVVGIDSVILEFAVKC